MFLKTELLCRCRCGLNLLGELPFKGDLQVIAYAHCRDAEQRDDRRLHLVIRHLDRRAADDDDVCALLLDGHGHRIGDGVSDDGTWWSSSECNTANAWNRTLNYNYGTASRTSNSKTYGFSVRCVKD